MVRNSPASENASYRVRGGCHSDPSAQSLENPCPRRSTSPSRLMYRFSTARESVWRSSARSSSWNSTENARRRVVGEQAHPAVTVERIAVIAWVLREADCCHQSRRILLCGLEAVKCAMMEGSWGRSSPVLSWAWPTWLWAFCAINAPMFHISLCSDRRIIPYDLNETVMT